MPINLITNLYRGLKVFRLRKIEDYKKDPWPYQERLLFDILNKAQDTEFGEKYNFENIKSVKDFQKTVPIQDYESIFPYIEKMLKGKENILWPGKITNFSKSSGTTARSKYLPVSEELLETFFEGGQDELALYLAQNKDSAVLEGKALYMGGSLEVIDKVQGITAGDMTAIMMHNMPLLGRYVMGPSLETSTFPVYEEKLERMVAEIKDENITSIAGTPTWTIALIKKIIAEKGVKNILEVWPNLEVFFHGAVAFGPYRKIFNELIPSEKMHYMETYNASEGFFAMQDDLSKKDEMLILPDNGIFYEFIKIQNDGTENNEVITLKDVKLDTVYSVIISSCAGLWRYAIGDTVLFTSLYPHRIKIAGRTKHFINAFGEELMIHNTDDAIKEISEKYKINIVDYTAGPFFMSDQTSGFHEWLIEFETEFLDIENFAKDLDAKLRILNSDYDAKRHRDIVLKNLIIKSLPKDTFYNWMKNRGKLGGQNKVPRLSNDRTHIESILKMLE